MEDDQKIKMEDDQRNPKWKITKINSKWKRTKKIKMKDNQKNLISKISKCNNNDD